MHLVKHSYLFITSRSPLLYPLTISVLLKSKNNIISRPGSRLTNNPPIEFHPRIKLILPNTSDKYK